MRYLRPKVLLKGSVLLAQCLSFRFDKLTFMSTVTHTISEHAFKGQWLGAAVKALVDLPSYRGNFFFACIALLDSDQGLCLCHHGALHVRMHASPELKCRSSNSDKCGHSIALIFPPQLLNTVPTLVDFFAPSSWLTTSTFFTLPERIQAVEPDTFSASTPRCKHLCKKPRALQRQRKIDRKFDQKRQTVSCRCFLSSIVSPER